MLTLCLKFNEHFADIVAIKYKEGAVLTEPKEVHKTFSSFYSELYTSEIVLEVAKCEEFLSRIQLTRLSSAEAASLDEPILMEEVREAILGMRKGRLPSFDGIPPEFYSPFWDCLGPSMLEMFHFAIGNGGFSRDVNVAIISLLCKKSKDPTDCANYTYLSP